MRGILVGIFLVWLGFTGAHAQELKFDYSHAEFSNDIKEKLGANGNPVAITIGESFAVAWASFGIDARNKIIRQTQDLIKSGHRLQPNLETYFAGIAYARNDENLSDQEIINLLNMTEKVINKYELSEELRYFKRLKSFFEYRALYHTEYLDMALRNDQYRFVFVDPEADLQAALAESAAAKDTTMVEEDWEEENWEEEEWEEEEWSEDDWQEEEAFEEEELSIGDLLAEEVTTRPLSGPTILFDNLDIDIQVGYDSLTLENVKGSMLIMEDVFVGTSARLDWQSAGYEKGEIFADIGKFELDVTTAAFVFPGAKLTYKDIFDQPLAGEVEFKPEKAKEYQHVKYPRFSSQGSNLELEGLVGPFSYYKGGFSLIGRRINSRAKFLTKSTFRMDSEGGKKFAISAMNIDFADSTMSSDRARLVIYNKFDSIFHPAVRVRFDARTNNLIVQKDNGDFRNTPFVSSANKMNFTADVVSWNLNQDSLYISTLLAKKEVPLLFQSNEYYDMELFRNVRGLYNFNPLKVVLSYCDKQGVTEFYVEEIAEARNINLKILQGAVMTLYQQGYVDYDQTTGVVSLTQKGIHKGEAQKGDADYDNLLLLSLVPEGTNAIFDMNTQEFHIYGVDKFYLAKVLDVSVEADSNKITILKNRDIKFNGRLAAGNFDYVGRDYIFRYDSFLVEMQQIDAIELYVMEETRDGFKRKKVNNSLSGIPEGGLEKPKEEPEPQVDSTAFDQTLPEDEPVDPNVGKGVAMASISGTSGVLYISKPNNKSGKELIPNYPKFQGGGTGSVVYFDKPEILGGVYDRSLYFTLPPFDLDSLSDSDPAAIAFAGVFHSDNWFPDFSEELHIMPDYSLGFDHSIPPEGYQLFGGNGRLYNHLSLDKNGIVGSGDLEFLTTTMNSRQFIFWPDSVAADGNLFNMRKEEFGGVLYPQISAETFHMKWLPMKDSMYISNIGPLFAMYDGLADLDGSVIVTNKGVNGLGRLNTYNSTTVSKDYTFNADDYSARHADFRINSDNPDKPAVAGADVRLAFDLETKQAEMSPEVAGVAAISFPYAQFNTSITKARWDLENQKVYMSKPEEVDINSSYFYTTREDLDSLNFNATNAEYDMQTLELKVSGIPYIKVADAKITPENGEVLILENSRIGTLYNTTIDLDTLTGYHEIYDATVTIISRNEFEGEGTYRLITAMKDTFGIKLKDFHLEEFVEGRRGDEVSLHSVATGSVQEEDNLMISPGMYYKGNVKLLAHKPALELDGYVKLDLKSIKDYNTWIKYQSEAEQQEITFLFDESVTSNGQLLSAGLHFDFKDFSLYSTFCYEKHDIQDEDFFKPSGYLSFKQDSSEYIIVNRDKDLGLTYAGKVFAYNENTRGIRFEGPIRFVDNSKTMGIIASAIGEGNMGTNELAFKSMLTMDFKIPSSIYNMMAEDFTKTIEEYGPPEANIDRTELLYLMAEIIGNRATKNYEEKSSLDYVPLVSTSPNMVRPFVFSNVNFKWSDEQKAFYNDGEVGLSNILRTDINAQFESFFEIRKTETGEIINLFLRASPESWYYFSYEENKLYIYSSNEELNEFVKEKTNIGKAKIGEFQFGPSDFDEMINFIQTFRAVYFDIDEPYDLQGEVSLKKKKDSGEADDEDDGF